MKSILLASASIVAFAGAAAAEVTFGGSAELGYNDTDALEENDDGDFVAGDDDQGFYWDADLSVTFTQALNNGLTASATVGIDLADTDNLGNDDLDAVDFAFSLTSDTAGLHFGNVDTAAEIHWDAAGASAGSMAADAFSYNDGGTVLRGDVMVAGVSAAVSYFIDDEELDQLQVAAAGTFGNFGVNFAYQEEGECSVDTDGDSNCGGDYSPNAVLGLSANTTFSGFTVQLAYAQWTGREGQGDDGEDEDDLDSIGVQVSYPVGPVTLGAYYVMESSDDNAFGISADYASGPITVSVNYEDTDVGDEDWSIEGTYSAEMFTVLVGVSDAGDDMYAAVNAPLGEDAYILVSFADDGDGRSGDEIGDPEYQEGLTAEVGFSF